MQKRVLPSKSDLRAAPVECTPRLCVCVCDREEKISLSGFETSHVVNTAWPILLPLIYTYRLSMSLEIF